VMGDWRGANTESKVNATSDAHISRTLVGNPRTLASLNQNTIRWQL
jgi:hypothetical protein